MNIRETVEKPRYGIDPYADWLKAEGIPVIEDRPLARSLYVAGDVDRPIPAEFYRAVAEIVHLIQQRKAQWAQRRQ